MTAVVPPAHITAPLALAARKCGYRIFKAPASGPAKIRSSAMNRPKNTAQTPHLSKSRLASATWPGPKCLGNRFPRRSNSDIPKRRPIEYPIVSPTMAPMVAAAATPTGLMSRVWRDDSSAALTSAISPGNGMPRLSTPMTAPTMRYTASGGIVCRKASMSTALTMPLVGVCRGCGEMFMQAARSAALGPDCSATCGHFHKSWFSCVHNGIEAVAGFQAPGDLLYGVLRKRGDVEVFPDATRSDRRGQDCGVTLNTPREEHLRRTLPSASSDVGDQGIVEQSRFHRVPEWCECQQNDALCLAVPVQFPLRMIRMGRNRDDRRFDPSGVDDPSSAIHVDVGQAYRSAKPFVDKAFHRCPGFLQRNPVVIYQDRK